MKNSINLPMNQEMHSRSYNFLYLLATMKNTIILFVCPSKILNKHCFEFLLGLTKSTMVFLIVANCMDEKIANAFNIL